MRTPPVRADAAERASGSAAPRAAVGRAIAGFTLFEVAISLLIVAVAVLAVAIAYPVGIKAERLARFRIYASAKMLEISDWWVQQEHACWDHQVEAEHLGQNPLMAYPNDLDTAADRLDSVLLPLPTTIARRFDSDNDEIARLLDAGGRLFYAPPQPFESGVEGHGGARPADWQPLPPEAQTLVFGVVGYAQQNALPNHPCLAMPYYDYYPSPAQQWERDNWDLHQQRGEQPWSAGWTAFDDLWNTLNAWSFDPGDGPRIALAVDKAVALCAAVGVTLDDLPPTGGTTLTAPLRVPRMPRPLSDFPAPWSPAQEDVFPTAARVLAIRYLALAANTWLGGGRTATADEVEYAKRTHDACLAWAARFASTDPYDWGAPRPLNRQNCFDFPLLQFDTTSPPVTTPDGENDRSWPVVGRGVGHDFGRGRGWYAFQGRIADNHDAIAASWGSPSAFTLTEPFEPWQRCRQLVCWSVDWLSYEDSESCPSEPLDAARHCLDSRGNQIAAEMSKRPDEDEYLFGPARDVAGGDKVMIAGEPFNGGYITWSRADGVMRDPRWRATWMGLYGADRNGNGRFDRGPLPATARIRATTVARFNFYDRRLIMAVRY